MHQTQPRKTDSNTLTIGQPTIRLRRAPGKIAHADRRTARLRTRTNQRRAALAEG